MAKKPAQPTQRTDQENAARMYQLMRWLREINVCGMCMVELAIAIIENENGMENKPEDTCERQDRRGRKCRQLLELYWKERPQAQSPMVSSGRG